MIYKNLEGVIPAPGKAEEDRDLLSKVDSAIEELNRRFDEFAFSIGLEAWMTAVFACNAYVDTSAPWALRKTDPERMADVLGTLVAAIRRLAVAVLPVIPASAEKLIKVIDDGLSGGLGQPTPIFPRLELPEEEGEAA
jgi:methionyl-tRNA synthetase